MQKTPTHFRRYAALLVAAFFFLPGCGTLIPKPVEFFQKKVEGVPDVRAAEMEIIRRAAQAAKERSETLAKQTAALPAPPEIQALADDTALLTDAVSVSLGPPKVAASVDYEARILAREVLTAVAKLNVRIDEFREEQSELVGKKIEGTGLFSVPYFVWILGVGVMLVIGFVVLSVVWGFVKMYAMSNPPLQLGVNAVQLGAKTLQKAVTEVYQGGVNFRNSLQAEVEDPKVRDAVWKLFVREQERAQSSDVQAMMQDFKAAKGQTP